MMGRSDAEAFLEEMPAWQFDRWKAFARVEPFGPAADDLRNALGVTILANVHRNPKAKSSPFTRDDFRLCKTFKQPVSPAEKARRLKEKLTAMWGTGKRKETPASGRSGDQ